MQNPHHINKILTRNEGVTVETPILFISEIDKNDVNSFDKLKSKVKELKMIFKSKMYRYLLSLFLCLCFISFLTSCNITKKKECLNYENFEKFQYNNKIYCLPDNFNEIYSKFDFYGNKHQVGYTIGVYNKIFKTYILDIDEEENILFQENGRYFWFKEGFVFPNTDELNITKLLIEKLDSEWYIIKEKEYVLENISLNEFFIEYAIDQNTDSFLNDDNNFLTFRIKYIYEDYIITNYYDRIIIYNDKVYIKKYNESNERKICIVNDKYALSLYDCILSMD